MLFGTIQHFLPFLKLSWSLLGALCANQEGEQPYLLRQVLIGCSHPLYSCPDPASGWVEWWGVEGGSTQVGFA